VSGEMCINGIDARFPISWDFISHVISRPYLARIASASTRFTISSQILPNHYKGEVIGAGSLTCNIRINSFRVSVILSGGGSRLSAYYAHQQAIHVEKNIFDFGDGYISRHSLEMAGLKVYQTPVTHRYPKGIMHSRLFFEAVIQSCISEALRYPIHPQSSNNTR
jgi:hypothetical protein